MVILEEYSLFKVLPNQVFIHIFILLLVYNVKVDIHLSGFVCGHVCWTHTSKYSVMCMTAIA